VTVSIREGSIDDIVHLQARINEFAAPYTKETIIDRLDDKTSLALVAHHEDELVGFKLGYAESKTQFYSWLGGVSPHARRQGIARRLLHHQEDWARNQGFKSLRVKSRNRFRAMMILLLNEGYLITGSEIKAHSEDSVIHFLKQLT